MVDYEEKILVLLAEKYRNSKKDSGTNRIVRRTQLEPAKLYKNYRKNDGDLGQIEAVNQAAERCRERGFLTYEMNGFSNEISRLYLVDEKILEIETYLSENYQYESKHVRKQYVEEMIALYSGRSPVAEAECEKLRQTLKKNKIPKDYQQAEDVLKALVFIENNQKTMYIREASMLIYGSSKYLEEKTLEHICRLLREFYHQPCEEGELPDEILRKHSIIKEQQRLCMKGGITIYTAGKTLDLSAFQDGVEISAEELARIEKIEIHTPELITVENRTSYLRFQKPQAALFYLGGYVTRSQRDFLKKVYENNRGVLYLHFGDIDAGGFYIFEQLCRTTGIPFDMYQMSVDVLQDERFRSCLQNLTENDRIRLESLAAKEKFREVAAYMLKQNVKLEQEIVSYTRVD